MKLRVTLKPQDLWIGAYWDRRDALGNGPRDTVVEAARRLVASRAIYGEDSDLAYEHLEQAIAELDGVSNDELRHGRLTRLNVWVCLLPMLPVQFIGRAKR